MAFTQFPKNQVIKTIDTGEKPLIGSHVFPYDQELKNIRVVLLVWGTLAGSEQVRINLHSSDDLVTPYASTSWVSLSDLTYNFGWVRFDFATAININSDITYYAYAETNNYTRNGSTLYLGIARMHPFSPTDTTGKTTPYRWSDLGLDVQSYGYRA